MMKLKEYMAIGTLVFTGALSQAQDLIIPETQESLKKNMTAELYNTSFEKDDIYKFSNEKDMHESLMEPIQACVHHESKGKKYWQIKIDGYQPIIITS